jgi:hypothetical protein
MHFTGAELKSTGVYKVGCKFEKVSIVMVIALCCLTREFVKAKYNPLAPFD